MIEITYLGMYEKSNYTLKDESSGHIYEVTRISEALNQIKNRHLHKESN